VCTAVCIVVVIAKIINDLSVTVHNEYGLQCVQLSVNTMKVECETHLLPHAVDVLSEDVGDNKRDHSSSPVCPFIKCETQVSRMLCPIY
jgi:hypothetical protein